MTQPFDGAWDGRGLPPAARARIAQGTAGPGPRLVAAGVRRRRPRLGRAQPGQRGDGLHRQAPRVERFRLPVLRHLRRRVRRRRRWFPAALVAAQGCGCPACRGGFGGPSCRWISGPVGYGPPTTTSGQRNQWAGYEPYADALYRGYDTALDRMLQEATGAGRRRRRRGPPTVRREAATASSSRSGTAVRARAPERAGPALRHRPAPARTSPSC